jgi:hypothetical protein
MTEVGDSDKETRPRLLDDHRAQEPWAGVVLSDAMILSYDANLGRMEFSERTGLIFGT